MEGSPGAADLGSACCGRVRQRPAMRGNSCRRQHGASQEAPCCSLRRVDEACLDQVRCGMVRRGAVGSGTAGQQLQTAAQELSGSSVALKRLGQGLAWRGEAGPGKAMQGDSCRRQHRGLRLPLLLSLEGGRGGVRQGRVRRVWVRSGNSCRRQH
jgi:hypothetical protein